jgi:hypothetical protein
MSWKDVAHEIAGGPMRFKCTACDEWIEVPTRTKREEKALHKSHRCREADRLAVSDDKLTRRTGDAWEARRRAGQIPEIVVDQAYLDRCNGR